MIDFRSNVMVPSKIKYVGFFRSPAWTETIRNKFILDKIVTCTARFQITYVWSIFDIQTTFLNLS